MRRRAWARRSALSLFFARGLGRHGSGPGGATCTAWHQETACSAARSLTDHTGQHPLTGQITVGHSSIEMACPPPGGGTRPNSHKSWSTFRGQGREVYRPLTRDSALISGLFRAENEGDTGTPPEFCAMGGAQVPRRSPDFGFLSTL